MVACRSDKVTSLDVSDPAALEESTAAEPKKKGRFLVVEQVGWEGRRD